MEEILIKISGEGKDLNTLQMSSRAVAIYLITLLLIRIAGRRTFGKKQRLTTPLPSCWALF